MKSDFNMNFTFVDLRALNDNNNNKKKNISFQT